MGDVITVDFNTKSVITLASTESTDGSDRTLMQDVRFYRKNDASRMAIMDALLRAKEITTSLGLSAEDPDVLCRFFEMRGSSLEDACLVLNSSTKETWKTYTHYFFAVSLHFSHRLHRAKLCAANLKSPI